MGPIQQPIFGEVPVSNCHTSQPFLLQHAAAHSSAVVASVRTGNHKESTVLLMSDVQLGAVDELQRCVAWPTQQQRLATCILTIPHASWVYV
jgi:hypothetical protein